MIFTYILYARITDDIRTHPYLSGSLALSVWGAHSAWFDRYALIDRWRPPYSGRSARTGTAPPPAPAHGGARRPLPAPEEGGEEGLTSRRRSRRLREIQARQETVYYGDD